MVFIISTRRQRVVINGHSSDWSLVLSGVPQGSILGPLLFILYINDLPSAVNSPMKIFADDVAMYCSVGCVMSFNMTWTLVFQVANAFKSIQM